MPLPKEFCAADQEARKLLEGFKNKDRDVLICLHSYLSRMVYGTPPEPKRHLTARRCYTAQLEPQRIVE